MRLVKNINKEKYMSKFTVSEIIEFYKKIEEGNTAEFLTGCEIWGDSEKGPSISSPKEKWRIKKPKPREFWAVKYPYHQIKIFESEKECDKFSRKNPNVTGFFLLKEVLN